MTESSENIVETTVQPVHVPSHGGWLRPWQKGQSGNPGGLGGPGSAYHECRRICAEATPEATRKLIELIGSDDQRVAFMAIKEVLERGIGKVRDHSNEQQNRIDLSALSDEERAAMLTMLKKAMRCPG
jgi:hypothetical protein